MREKNLQIDGDGAGSLEASDGQNQLTLMKTDKKETETQKDEKGASRDDD